MKLENKAQTIIKPARLHKHIAVSSSITQHSIQWLIFACESSFHAPYFHFHGHSFPFLHSGLCWLPIWQVSALFNHPNACNSIKLSCECLQFTASHLQVVFLVSRDLFYSRSGLVNGYHTAPWLLFAREDLRHHLGV